MHTVINGAVCEVWKQWLKVIYECDSNLMNKKGLFWTIACSLHLFIEKLRDLINKLTF